MLSSNRRRNLRKAVQPLTSLTLTLTIGIILSLISESYPLRCYVCPYKHACNEEPHIVDCGAESHCIKEYWKAIDNEENYSKRCDFALESGCETRIEEPVGGISAEVIYCACNDKDLCNGGRASVEQSFIGKVSLWILSAFSSVGVVILLK